MGQPLMMVQVQAGGGAASYDGTCAGWGWGSLSLMMIKTFFMRNLVIYRI